MSDLSVIELLDLERARVAETELERNHWIRLFNRLDAAVSRHRRGCVPHFTSEGCVFPPFASEADEALWDAHDKILKTASEGATK